MTAAGNFLRNVLALVITLIGSLFAGFIGVTVVLIFLYVLEMQR